MIFLKNQGCLVSVGLQIKAAKFLSISPLKLTFEKPIICKKNDIAVILKKNLNLQLSVSWVVAKF